ncbi:MAG: hypothetical protein CUN55_18725 [Phototrophicales bacterium]|nr:MAG: hypothetical protein CUN55_18725 [Phototrophicales bacterium]
MYIDRVIDAGSTDKDYPKLAMQLNLKGRRLIPPFKLDEDAKDAFRAVMSRPEFLDIFFDNDKNNYSQNSVQEHFRNFLRAWQEQLAVDHSQ